MKDGLFSELDLAYNTNTLSSLSYTHLPYIAYTQAFTNNLTILISGCQLSILYYVDILLLSTPVRTTIANM